jgi:outer membrane protein assembly factor BamB
VGGDDRFVFGTEENGAVIAWRRSDGERAWQQDQVFKYRYLTAPLAAGRTVIIGDSTGLLHFLSRDDGSPLNRVTPDGSPITVTPVLAGNTAVVVTRNGGVFGYRPE